MRPMANQDDYVRLTARLPPEIHEEITKLADRHARSLNGEIIALLQSAISAEGVEGLAPGPAANDALLAAQQEIVKYVSGAAADVQREHLQLLQEYLRLKPGQRQALLAFLKKL